MLGILYGLLECQHTMRPSVAPLALVLQGAPAAAAPQPVPLPPVRVPSPTPAVGQGHTLLAAGDSWLCYESSINFKPQNLANCLRVQHGFTVEVQQSYTAPGNWLRHLISSPIAACLLWAAKVAASSY